VLTVRVSVTHIILQNLWILGKQNIYVRHPHKKTAIISQNNSNTVVFVIFVYYLVDLKRLNVDIKLGS